MESIRQEGPLARALARKRDRYNARFAYARQQYRGLEPEGLARHLSAYVEPIVDAVAQAGQPPTVDETAIDRVTEALFDISVQLVGRNLMGSAAPAPAMHALWQQFLPRVPDLVAERPRQLVSALSNAVFGLSRQAGVDAMAWLQEIDAIAPHCAGAGALLDAGKVVAWRSGMAHWRKSALEVWNGLDDRLRYATLGFDPDGDELPGLDEIGRRMEDPWQSPNPCDDVRADAVQPKKLQIVARVGGFRGLGGPFLAPPRVMARDGQIFAFDDEACWTLHADCFGATFQRFAAGPPEPNGQDADSSFDLDGFGQVRRGDELVQLPVFHGHTSSAANSSTLAVTLRHSHQVWLVAFVARPTGEA